jgi:predicted Zn-ribbon and HTH transcriptional regulator
MRATPRHQPAEERRRARPRTRLLHRRVSGKAARRSADTSTARAATASDAVLPTPADEIATGLDIAAQRVRAAGGPTDEASYTCSCGYTFAASVSTTVVCPHCGSEQAW